MILTCSKCDTRYHVDPTGLGAEGRTVRCASCGHRWTAKPPADAPKPIEPQPPRVPSGASGASVGRRSSPRVVAWLVAALIILVLASAWVGRNEIVARIPASVALYQALGLPVAMRLGLEFA